MKRAALIIGNPGEPGSEGYCKGVERDLENYGGLLRSPIGGLWYDGEIEVLMRPSVAQVKDAMGRIKAADYGLAVFAGHGCERNQSTILQLRAGVEIDSDLLKLGSPRQTVILDCCRVLERPREVAREMIKAARMRAEIHPDKCRRLFDHELGEAPPGLVVMWACSPGETAGDDELRGGFYSGSVVRSGTEWATSSTVDTTSKYSVFSVVNAHTEAYQQVQRMSGGRQHPRIAKPRSETFYPFCIVA